MLRPSPGGFGGTGPLLVLVAVFCIVVFTIQIVRIAT